MRHKPSISYTLNIGFGVLLLIIFGSIAATGKVEPWEPNIFMAYLELSLGIFITLFGTWGLFSQRTTVINESPPMELLKAPLIQQSFDTTRARRKN